MGFLRGLFLCRGVDVFSVFCVIIWFFSFRWDWEFEKVIVDMVRILILFFGFRDMRDVIIFVFIVI